jgi:hypothetical protein
MHERRIERATVDVDLVIARRRADACTPGSPSWDAAMGLVQELEDELRQVEETPDPRRESAMLASPRN